MRYGWKTSLRQGWDFGMGAQATTQPCFKSSHRMKSSEPYRIYNSWSEDQEFIELAKRGLNKIVTGNALLRLRRKLKEVKIMAKEW